MKTKYQKDFEKWAMPKINKLQSILLLHDHGSITLEYNEKSPNESVCLLNFPYKQIDIKYSNEVLEHFNNNNKQEALRVLTHEMCHVLTDPIYSKAFERFLSKSEIEDTRESLTDHLANIIITNKLI